MTLTQMRYFYEVCKWSSITKAAASLHISQPTVSIAMADLKKESGLNLFRRESKKTFAYRRRQPAVK
ncbi:MAG: LysR family transcriptional regulator [Acidaminococcaceae bacterium]|nr:LysR family transcriptional regulator [Acidaminococcaceae bacterium]